MKCPTCKRAKCVWVSLNPKKAKTERLKDVVAHNLSFIDMTFNGHQGGSGSEERLYDLLEPYSQELERRELK